MHTCFDFFDYLIIYRPSFELALAFISFREGSCNTRKVDRGNWVCISLIILIKIGVVVKVYDWMQLFFNINNYNLQI